ncbi:Protein F43C9.2 [Aphelenchoides avenae]|nr:Protein F43C9.2 [Aphelenchus avenae]
MAELEEQFRQCDGDRDGAITFDELREILYKTADLHDDEIIEAMFTATDSDHDGRISFNEFVHMMREE